jgi:hypothetical protein
VELVIWRCGRRESRELAEAAVVLPRGARTDRWGLETCPFRLAVGGLETMDVWIPPIQFMCTFLFIAVMFCYHAKKENLCPVLDQNSIEKTVLNEKNV